MNSPVFPKIQIRIPSYKSREILIKQMKILFSGYHNPKFITITEYFERAVTALGHELFTFDDRRHLIPGRIRRRIPLLNRLDSRYINRNLISLALSCRPDVAIVSGGHRISAESVKTLGKNGIDTVLWTIDPPQNFQPIIQSAPTYNYIVCQGSEAIELLHKAGIKGARLLPAGCDPDYHHPVDMTLEEKEQYGQDVVFVGSYYPNRLEILDNISGFNLGIWGPGWDRIPAESPLRIKIKGGQVTPDVWTKIYGSSKIVVIAHYQDGKIPCYQASPKVFEALACGTFVLVDRQRDVLSLFKEGEHLVVFNDKDDLKNKISYYLENPAKRDRIARSGREKTLQEDTYICRVKQLVDLIASSKKNK